MLARLIHQDDSTSPTIHYHALRNSKARRLRLIAERARAHAMRRQALRRMEHVERQLYLETQARLESVSLALQIKRSHANDNSPRSSLPAKLSLLLATILSTRELLTRHCEACRHSAGGALGAIDDKLYDLERQAEALYLAATACDSLPNANDAA